MPRGIKKAKAMTVSAGVRSAAETMNELLKEGWRAEHSKGSTVFSLGFSPEDLAEMKRLNVHTGFLSSGTITPGFRGQLVGVGMTLKGAAKKK